MNEDRRPQVARDMMEQVMATKEREMAAFKALEARYGPVKAQVISEFANICLFASVTPQLRMTAHYLLPSLATLMSIEPKTLSDECASLMAHRMIRVVDGPSRASDVELVDVTTEHAKETH